MEDKEETIEFHLINKDIWKDFINEPKQNKSLCLLLNLEISIFEIQAKTHFFTAEGIYELNDKQISFKKTAKAVLLINSRVQSIHLVQLEKSY